MSKYSKEFKLEVMKYYEKYHVGCGELAEHFKIPNCYIRKDKFLIKKCLLSVLYK